MDPQTKKTVLRTIVYGLYGFGVRRGDESHAMTVNWVTQVSFEPPLIAIAVENESHSLPMVREARAFALSIFASGDKQLAGRLGRSSRNVPDKLSGVAHHTAPVTGSPVLDEATGWLDCRVVSEQPAGDHVVLIAEVVDAGIQRQADTLTLKETGWRYAG